MAVQVAYNSSICSYQRQRALVYIACNQTTPYKSHIYTVAINSNTWQMFMDNGEHMVGLRVSNQLSGAM